MKKTRPWTKEEKKYVDQKIAKINGDSSVAPRRSNNYKYSDEERATIKKLTPEIGLTETARLLGRSKEGVRKHCIRHRTRFLRISECRSWSRS